MTGYFKTNKNIKQPKQLQLLVKCVTWNLLSDVIVHAFDFVEKREQVVLVLVLGHLPGMEGLHWIQHSITTSSGQLLTVGYETEIGPMHFLQNHP